MKSDMDDIDPVTEPIEEYVHRLFRAAAGSLPIGAGAAVEILNSLWAPPLEQRKLKWMRDVTNDLAILERKQAGIIESLFQNEEFISLLTMATRESILSHQAKKLGALRAAVLNAASGITIPFDKQALFLGYITRFTVQHLLLLDEIGTLPPESTGGPIPVFPESLEEKLSTASAYLQAVSENDLRVILVRDLLDAGLINISDKKSHPTLSLVGSSFLEFIQADIS